MFRGTVTITKQNNVTSRVGPSGVSGKRNDNRVRVGSEGNLGGSADNRGRRSGA
jgi:hypothetical protein